MGRKALYVIGAFVVAGALVVTAAVVWFAVETVRSALPKIMHTRPAAMESQPLPDPAAVGNQQPVKLPLMTLRPQSPVVPSLAQLEAAFPEVGHRPFEKAGFSAVVLPFLFVSKNQAGDPAEALAFSFLLSNSLDWAPGSYCARHAFFVFKRDREIMLPMSKKYAKGDIRDEIENWAATHAIGGTIVADKDGYSGTLLIYTDKGVMHKKDYPPARDYFDLLGDMSVDAMTLLDQAPGPELVRHLHMKRCQPESLIDLGRAAFLPERGAEEFGLYDKILRRDPGFADVRYWWANQKHWDDGDDQAYLEQIVQALDAYPVPELWQVPPDSVAPERYKRWLDQARALGGPDNHRLLSSELDVALRNKHSEVGPLIDRLKRTISRYPNENILALQTAKAMCEDIRFADADAAVSLCLIAMKSSYLTGSGKNWEPVERLSNLLTDFCGRHDWAAGLALDLAERCRKAQNSDVDTGVALWHAGDALTELGQYAQATEAYVKAFPLLKDEGRKMLTLSGAGVAMALSGQRDRLERLCHKQEELARKANCLSIWQAYLDLLDGKKVDTVKIKEDFVKDPYWSVRLQHVHLYAQACYVQGEDKGQNELAWYLRSHPECRLSWVLFDAFDRRWPDKKSAAFYESLEWLHGQDPWVKQAVADFHQRTPTGQAPNADELLKILVDYPPVRWPDTQRSEELKHRDAKILNSTPPGAFAAAIRNRIGAGDFAKARELALRFHNLVAAGPDSISTPMYAKSLIYKVEASRPEAVGMP